MLQTQFPDLIEFENLYGVDKNTIDCVKTEFMFYLKSPCRSCKPESLGFKAVSCMNNWWPSHCGESRKLTLYWMRAPGFTGEPQVPFRKRWSYTSDPTNKKWFSIEEHLAGSGCGFKIGEPPLKVSLFNRFFTLMRMPVEVTPLQKRWLTRYNYRLLDIGKLASYWINGWKPEEYTSAKEYKYFKTTQKEWRETGMKGYD